MIDLNMVSRVWLLEWRSSQKGLVSSHFFFRFRHVVQPVFDRALACFERVVGERGG
jgi:hypothetical protein